MFRNEDKVIKCDNCSDTFIISRNFSRHVIKCKVKVKQPILNDVFDHHLSDSESSVYDNSDNKNQGNDDHPIENNTAGSEESMEDEEHDIDEDLVDDNYLGELMNGYAINVCVFNTCYAVPSVKTTSYVCMYLAVWKYIFDGTHLNQIGKTILTLPRLGGGATGPRLYTSKTLCSFGLKFSDFS